MGNFETKDSGKRSEYASGMVRDTEEGKARFDLVFPEGVPYAEQMVTRFADLMARGAEKYSERNWEKARGREELARYRSSALRHLIQWMTGETDEDHAAAVMFNILAGETVKYRMGNAAWAYPHPEATPVHEDLSVYDSDTPVVDSRTSPDFLAADSPKREVVLGDTPSLCYRKWNCGEHVHECEKIARHLGDHATNAPASQLHPLGVYWRNYDNEEMC